MTTGADRGEIAEVGSPVQVRADPVDGVGPWRWTTAAITVATLFLAIANAHAIGEWFDELTPRPATEQLRRPIDDWMRTTAGWHLDAPRAALRARWKAAQAARFGDEQPGERGVEAP